MKRVRVAIPTPKRWECIPIYMALTGAIIFMITVFTLLLHVTAERVAITAGGIGMMGVAVVTAAVMEGLGATPATAIITIGKTATAIQPPPRLPLAFPPQAGQCYVCGVIDPGRKDVLGDDTHWSCIEWLGDWKMPDWQIRGDGYGTTTHTTLPGTKTPTEVRDYCNQYLGTSLEYHGLTATLGEGPNARILKIPRMKTPLVPKASEHTGWKILSATTGQIIDTLPWAATPSHVQAYCNAKFTNLTSGEMVATRPSVSGGTEFLDITLAPRAVGFPIINDTTGTVVFTGSGISASQLRLERLHVGLAEVLKQLGDNK